MMGNVSNKLCQIEFNDHESLNLQIVIELTPYNELSSYW